MRTDEGGIFFSSSGSSSGELFVHAAIAVSDPSWELKKEEKEKEKEKKNRCLRVGREWKLERNRSVMRVDGKED